MRSRSLVALSCLVGAAILSAPPPPAGARSEEAAGAISGRVSDAGGAAVPGAMVTFQQGDPAHSVTVFSDGAGRYTAPAPETPQALTVRVRRIGWKDLRLESLPARAGRPLDFTLERETDPVALADQLPANRWFHLVLERIEDPDQLEEFKRQCTFCHQQGNAATRVARDEEEWRKLLLLMGRRGGMLSRELREALPAHFVAAYDPDHAVAALTARMGEADFAPPPEAEVRRAVVEEWELGGRASMQHDVTVHPDGRIYSVDMSQDQLYRLDPSVPGGKREAWDIPQGDLPLGGVFASARTTSSTTNAHVGPHSLQVGPDGSVWITLALGNQLARFDPESEEWLIEDLRRGFYPHTLRIDAQGRIWYTISASNHLGMFDPASGEHRQIRLPSRTFGQAVIVRAMPFLLWLGRYVDLRGSAAEGEGVSLPVPYGIDIAPDGTPWFSQLNEHRIGRIDPESFEIELIDTPFPAPRRLRFDSQGKLWVPSFSGSLIARFDPHSREFKSWELPIEPRGSETPYALHVDRRTDEVWICGTNSDTLIRFQPRSERFTVYPLPTRVTYTREIDFDAEGRVWTSNSNSPAWQIEGGVPRLLRLDPRGAARDVAAAR
ncbi:MAG: carboxypeptidase regulatory-like domain-containing protein [Myxococcota bacterium]